MDGQTLLNAWAWWPSMLVAGLLVGSFLNVVVYRWPVIEGRKDWRAVIAMLGETEAWHSATGAAMPQGIHAPAREMSDRMESLGPFSLAAPRSRCGSCGHQLPWYENIPVVSWLFLRGRCAVCSSPISWRYPAVELMTGACWLACSLSMQGSPKALLWAGFISAVIALALIDLDTMFLPDAITLPLMWAGLAVALAGWGLVDPRQALLGAAAGYLSLWVVYWCFRLIAGKEGLGYGDFKLLAAVGAWLGPMPLIFVVLFAAVSSVILGIVTKVGRGTAYPFGPHLVLGAIAGVAVFFSPYKGMISHFL